MESPHKKTNRLIHSLSPYLLQHAHNPVDWYEWGPEAFEKAEKENKLLLISIGYSACHWCHVMAHECFEDEATAQLMNELFVCIKIDREELPDVDQIYMDACQLVNSSGGWPLNAFALPDKRPLHALTYAPRPQWQQILKSIQQLWTNEPETAKEYAEKLSRGIANMSLPPQLDHNIATEKHSEEAFSTFVAQYDTVYGGPNRAPKFPMPNNYKYLLQYGELFGDQKSQEMGLHTLQQMALGGIYDAVGGGFARYSVDKRWFAPHFEKMLYDNAQLISLYSYAFAVSQDPFYKNIAYQTIRFCKEELLSENGLYHSAYDADSEGVEGLYYTYTFDDLQSVLKDDTELFCKYYQCTPEGNWEHGRNILYAMDTMNNAAKQFEQNEVQFISMITESLAKLKVFREQRVKPGLDDKCICSWNNLMLKALAESALWLNDKTLVSEAEQLADAILKTFYKDGTLKRIAKNDTVKIDAFLEDHATLIDALISTYQASFNETYLLKAKDLTEATINLFYNHRNGFFEFNANTGETLITPKYDISDDVISSGNSIMAHNLWRLSWYFDTKDWRDMAGKMLNAMIPQIRKSAPWYSHWAALLLFREEGTHQIILSAGEDARQDLLLNKYYRTPNALFGFAGQQTAIPLFKGKEFKGETLIYPCLDFTCSAPEKPTI